MREVVEYARSIGWTVTLTRSGHYRYEKPGRAIVFSSSTPSCHRAAIKTRKLLDKSERESVGAPA